MIYNSVPFVRTQDPSIQVSFPSFAGLDPAVTITHQLTSDELKVLKAEYSISGRKSDLKIATLIGVAATGMSTIVGLNSIVLPISVAIIGKVLWTYHDKLFPTKEIDSLVKNIRQRIEIPHSSNTNHPPNDQTVKLTRIYYTN